MPTEEQIRKAAETLNAMDVPKRSESELQMLAKFNQEQTDAEMRVAMPEQRDAARREMRRLLLATKDEDLRDAYYRALTLTEHEARRAILEQLDAERQTHLLEAAKADDAIEVLEQELRRERAESERLRACLHAMAAADDGTTTAAFKSVAYDAVMNLITSSVAEHQLVRRSHPDEA
jgi:hypothetical protein